MSIYRVGLYQDRYATFTIDIEAGSVEEAKKLALDSVNKNDQEVVVDYGEWETGRCRCLKLVEEDDPTFTEFVFPSGDS